MTTTALTGFNSQKPTLANTGFRCIAVIQPGNTTLLTRNKPFRPGKPHASPIPPQRRQRPLCRAAISCSERQPGTGHFDARTQLIRQCGGGPHAFPYVSYANRCAFGFCQLGGFQKIEGVRAHHDGATAGGGFD